ncbi:serine/arginine repetitive matrix protein 4 [Esox lucius]|uniref:serine/arginine repetitive matrix protein 4 n=1 Tax=Esox lucius TaxID=8010 RepID=UPI0014775730|nr:serine/arginine repetitive matrix protein 4 [Esox lucius]
MSPVRKRKKKKKNKKSSKKSKRHRYTSKKTKHSSSSLKRKRRDDRKHKKSSRGHTHRRRHYQRSESEESSACRSSSVESRHHLHKSADKHSSLGYLSAWREDPGTTRPDRRGFEWGSAIKSVCKTTQIFHSILSAGTVLQSKPGGEVLNTTAVHHHTLTNQSKGPQDYDSGNDTSSPPSTKTGVSRSNISGENKVQAPASPEKHKFTDGDNASDSGNSVTSYASLCKPLHVDGLPAPIYNVICKSEPVITSGDGARLGSTQKAVSSIAPLTAVTTSRKWTKANSSSSRSRSRSSASSRRSRRYSRSQSRSSARSYSRSSSCSAGWRKKGSVDSVMSRGSYSRYSKDRIQERKRDPISCEKGLKHSSRKRSGKRCRRRSYSPMRKRRRDSPSHLEARRITSARKRPIPYFRPSPSSSSRSTSISSWSSIFTRSRSPSPSPGFFLSRSRSRSRRRSRSYSSCRSYSRSSSCNSTFGSRSRSRSYDSPDSYGKGKKRH